MAGKERRGMLSGIGQSLDGTLGNPDLPEQEAATSGLLPQRDDRSAPVEERLVGANGAKRRGNRGSLEYGCNRHLQPGTACHAFSHDLGHPG
jgi:hypothetical protein